MFQAAVGCCSGPRPMPQYALSSSARPVLKQTPVHGRGTITLPQPGIPALVAEGVADTLPKISLSSQAGPSRKI